MFSRFFLKTYAELVLVSIRMYLFLLVLQNMLTDLTAVPRCNKLFFALLRWVGDDCCHTWSSDPNMPYFVGLGELVVVF